MSQPYRAILGIFLLGVAAWAVLVWQSDGDNPFSGISIGSKASGGDFTLNTSKGAISLSDYHGKVVALYFGYTHCPDICPTSLSSLAAAFGQLHERELDRVQGIFISVDPERDSLEHLATYANFFHPKIIGVTGNMDAIAETAARYGAAYRRHASDSAMSYLVDHTANIYLIDRSGKLAFSYPHGTAAGELASSIRLLLRDGRTD